MSEGLGFETSWACPRKERTSRVISRLWPWGGAVSSKRVSHQAGSQSCTLEITVLVSRGEITGALAHHSGSALMKSYPGDKVTRRELGNGTNEFLHRPTAC